jgi:hypothetical protein
MNPTQISSASWLAAVTLTLIDTFAAWWLHVRK